MRWLSGSLNFIFHLIQKIKDWIKFMDCIKKAISKVEKEILPNEPITKEEIERIKVICAAKLGLPWYRIADLILQERQFNRIVGKISHKIDNLTDEELEWIFDCLKYSSWGLDELISKIRESRKNNTSPPKPK